MTWSDFFPYFFSLYIVLKVFHFFKKKIIQVSINWTRFKWNREYQQSWHLQRCSSTKKGSFLIYSDKDHQCLKSLDERPKGDFTTEGSAHHLNPRIRHGVVWCDKILKIQSHLWSILTPQNVETESNQAFTSFTLKENPVGRGTSSMASWQSKQTNKTCGIVYRTINSFSSKANGIQHKTINNQDRD